MERKEKSVKQFGSDNMKEVKDILKEKKQNLKNMRKFWHGFRILTPNSAIIRGSFAMDDKRFKLGSRGLQAVPSCITAIVFGSLLDPEDWNKDFVDRILIYGDKLFRISRTKNRVHSDVNMSASLIYPEFFIEDYKCCICATESIVYGNLFTENSNCPDLINGVEHYFTSSEAGVLTTQGISVAVWRHSNGDFFYFNPGPCADDGSKYRDGTACIMWFKCLNNMLDLILSNLNKKWDSKYSIDRINILHITPIRKSDFRRPDQTKTVTEMQLNCSSPTSQEQSVIKMSKIRRIPVSVIISNSNTDQQVAGELLDTKNTFDINYTYSDVRVNVPSTFKQLSNSAWILHGWTHENSEVYKGKGGQNVANCLMSIGMKKVNPVKTWLRTTLDEILTLGDAIYAQFKIDKPNIKELTAVDLNNTKLQIENKKMIANVDVLTIIGMLSSRITSVLNLKSAVKEFFSINNSGIIETSIMAVAIWTEDEYYYMFDPRQCDPSGFRVVEEKKKGKAAKKDNLSGKEKKINGKCCVIRFSDINSLAAHFIQNIPLGKKNDRFVIRNINIVDDVPGTQPWYNFEPGEPGKTWFLQGSVTNDDEILNIKNRAFLDIAISIVSLVFAKKIPPSEWTKDIVENVIHEGVEYYNWCISPDQEDKQFDFANLKKILYVNNQRVNLELEEATVVGNINVSSENRYLSLEKEITGFFENYQYAVVEVNDMTFAIWKELDSKDSSKKTYYLFVLNPKSPNNLIEQKEPVGCIMRTLNIADVARFIDANLEYSAESDLQFLIHNVDILQIGNVLSDEEIENEKKTTLKPDLHQYTNINEETACLNGSINQGNELLFNHQTRHKQQAGNALLALAMTKFHNPHLWSKQMIDDILKMGDKITAENIKNVSASEEETRDWLLPSEISTEFNVGINHIRFELQEDFVTGKLNNLSKILEEFFAEKDVGIFKLESTIMPIWKQGSVFFTMDPKGRDSQGIPKEKDGTAAVLWFTSISALASDLNRTAGGNANADFSLDSISIENNYETKLTDAGQQKLSTEEMWYSFEKQSDGVWYINGNIEFTNVRFNEENRGKQSAAIAIIAVVFSKIYSPHRWTAEVLDQVIITGDKLHSNCTTRFENIAIPRVNQIMTEFFMSDRRINLSINDCVQSGGFDNHFSKIQDVLSGVNKFFDQYPSGILTVNGDTNLAIWRSEDLYYYLLPTSRLMRFARTADLVNQLLTDFNIVDYEIVAVEVINWNKMPPWTFDPSPIIRPLILPSLNAFKRLQGAARALLRGTSHQASEIFSEKVRNQQAAANCIAALGMSVVKSPDTWTKSTLDEVLLIGNSIYQESLKTWPGKERLRPENIIRIFHLGHNVLTVDVSTPVISGQVSIPPPEPETKGKKQKPKKKPDRKKKKGKVKRGPPIPTPHVLLEEGINKFFENNNAGVLVVGRSVIAIWKQLGVYFMYVSYAWNDQGIKDNSGSSCAAWFACIEPFYNLIYTNLDDSEKYSTYEIRRILFKTTAIQSLPCLADLSVCELSTSSTISTSKIEKILLSGIKILNTYNHDYKELSTLHGTRNMNDIMFDEKNRGLQSTAIAVVAIVVGSIHVPSMWTPDIIDAILKYGDLLHLDSSRLLKISSRNLSPSELHSVFIVGDFRAHVHVHHYTMTGLLYPYDVAETLHFFFKSNISGILHTNNVAMAVSQHYGKFYLFDPCRRSGKSNSEEPACVMKFSNITVLAHAFVANCNSNKPSVYTLNAVNVLSLYSFSNAKRSYFLKCET